MALYAARLACKHGRRPVAERHARSFAEGHPTTVYCLTCREFVQIVGLGPEEED